MLVKQHQTLRSRRRGTFRNLTYFVSFSENKMPFIISYTFKFISVDKEAKTSDVQM